MERIRNNKSVNGKKRDGKDLKKEKDNKGFTPESYIDLLQKLVVANQNSSFNPEQSKPKERKEKTKS